MVASHETVLKAHKTYISKQLYAIVCGEGVCKTIDLTTYIELILFLKEQSDDFLHLYFHVELETSNFGYLLIFKFSLTVQSFRKIGQT